MNAPMIHVGASKETIKEARSAILDFLKAPNCDDKTKRAALHAFTEVCKVDGLTISNCTLNGSGK